MNTIAQRKPRTYPGHIINREDPLIWKENKKPIFRWADNEASRKGYKPQVTNLLKTIISLTNNKLKTIATIPTIIKKLNTQYPNSTKCPRTINRHLAILEKGKSIKRGQQLNYNSPCPTSVLATKLVNSSATFCRTESRSVGLDNRAVELITPTAPIPSTFSKARAPLSAAPAPEYEHLMDRYEDSFKDFTERKPLTPEEEANKKRNSDILKDVLYRRNGK